MYVDGYEGGSLNKWVSFNWAGHWTLARYDLKTDAMPLQFAKTDECNTYKLQNKWTGDQADDKWLGYSPCGGYIQGNSSKDGAATFELVSQCNETMSGPQNRDYRGCQSQTRGGQTCQKWTAQFPHAHDRTPENYQNRGLGDHNQCRNADGSLTIWCYTTDEDTRWDYCDPAPESQFKMKMVSKCDETMSGDMGSGYRGCQSRTVTGRTCQAWTADSPHETSKEFVTPANLANGLDHNYCRNLNGFETIWCYTDDPERRWEYCEPIAKYGYLSYLEKDHMEHAKGSIQADYTQASAMIFNLHRDCPPDPTANLAAESHSVQILQPANLAAESPAMEILQENPLIIGCFAGVLVLVAASGIRRSTRRTGDLYTALTEH
jgi:hypothetical protein